MFKKKYFNSPKIYSVKPTNISSTFIYLLHLLTDEDILLTYQDRDKLYKYIYSIIEFLEVKKNGTNN